MKNNRKKWLNLVYVLLFSLVLAGCGTYDVSPGNALNATKPPVSTDKTEQDNVDAVLTETPSVDEAGTDSDVETEDSTSEPTEAPLPKKESVPTEAPTATPEPTLAPTSTPVPTASPKPTATPTPNPTATPIPTSAPAAEKTLSPEEIARSLSFSFSSVPAYGGNAYAVINENEPFFTEVQLTDVSFEYYSPLDSLGRCGTCVASVGRDIMPTEDRGEIGSVKPSGWNQAKYPGLVDGNYLYNRCHLIGFQLTGENANTKNLITGTRYFNVDAMLPFENMVADYVKETGNHVMYRVTPVFEGKNLQKPSESPMY